MCQLSHSPCPAKRSHERVSGKFGHQSHHAGSLVCNLATNPTMPRRGRGGFVCMQTSSRKSPEHARRHLLWKPSFRDLGAINRALGCLALWPTHVPSINSVWCVPMFLLLCDVYLLHLFKMCIFLVSNNHACHQNCRPVWHVFLHGGFSSSGVFPTYISCVTNAYSCIKHQQC